MPRWFLMCVYYTVNMYDLSINVWRIWFFYGVDVGLNTEKDVAESERSIQGEEVVKTRQGYDRIAAFTCIYIFFIVFFVFAVFETWVAYLKCMYIHYLYMLWNVSVHFCAVYMLCTNCDPDNPWIALHKPCIYALRNNPWIVHANCGSALCATQSQAPQTKGTGHNRKEGLQSATQGDVRDSYIGLRILCCSL